MMTYTDAVVYTPAATVAVTYTGFDGTFTGWDSDTTAIDTNDFTVAAQVNCDRTQCHEQTAKVESGV